MSEETKRILVAISYLIEKQGLSIEDAQKLIKKTITT